MPEVKGDIDYASDSEETTFSANTPAGETFLGGPELTVSNTEAAAVVAKARAAGLTIGPSL
jgi:hypothetical protein